MTAAEAERAELLEARPKVDEGLIWYTDASRDLCVVASSLMRGRQHARLASRADIALLEAVDGTRTIDEIAAQLSVTRERVVAAIDRWEALAPQTFLWIRSAAEEARRDRLRAAALDLMDEARAARAPAPGSAHYHATSIENAWTQFERDETTVSHGYRLPHRALNGRTYGEAFCDRLLESGVFAQPGELRVLEIGGGTGLFAKALLDRLARIEPAAYARLAYEVFDLSPTLQASQRANLRDHEGRARFTRGDILATEPVGAGAGFDLVIANEMIADLPVDLADRGRLARGEAETPGERLVLRHALELHGAPRQFMVNTGALELCAKLRGWLAPGGTAIVTEYGAESLPPRAVDLPGHREHSIRFDHLRTFARQAGLEAELHSLGHFLGFAPDHETIGFRSAHVLFEHLLPLLDVPSPPFVAYDAPALRDVLGPLSERVANVRFHRLDGVGALLTPFGFQALVLRAPGNR